MSHYKDIIAPYSKDICPGCVITVVRNGEAVFDVNVGYENLESAILISPCFLQAQHTATATAGIVYCVSL